MGRHAGWIALHAGHGRRRQRHPDPRAAVRHRRGRARTSSTASTSRLRADRRRRRGRDARRRRRWSLQDGRARRVRARAARRHRRRGWPREIEARTGKEARADGARPHPARRHADRVRPGAGHPVRAARRSTPCTTGRRARWSRCAAPTSCGCRWPRRPRELKTVPAGAVRRGRGLLRLSRRAVSAVPLASGRRRLGRRNLLSVVPGSRPVARTCPPPSSRSGPTRPRCDAVLPTLSTAAAARGRRPRSTTLRAPARPRSRRARRSCCRAATAPRPSTSTPSRIRGKLQTLLQMAVVLTYGASVPVVKVGRVAGQYAKPRSLRHRDARRLELPSYRGDMVNGARVDAEARDPGPAPAGARPTHRPRPTLNLIRAFARGGYADLRQVHAWNQDFVRELAGRRALRADRRRDRPGAGVHEGLRRRPDEALARRRALRQPRGADPRLRARADRGSTRGPGAVRRVRRTSSGSASAPASWTARTSSSRRGSPTRSASRSARRRRRSEAVELVERLDPEGVPGPADADQPDGRRQGPRRAAADRREGHRQRPPGRVGVRPDARQHPRVADRLQDPALRPTSSTRCAASSTCTARWAPGPGGIHVELTGEDVTECLGGTGGVSDADLDGRYETACDPRLNPGSRWSWRSSSRRCCWTADGPCRLGHGRHRGRTVVSESR